MIRAFPCAAGSGGDKLLSNASLFASPFQTSFLLHCQCNSSRALFLCPRYPSLSISRILTNNLRTCLVQARIPCTSVQQHRHIMSIVSRQINAMTAEELRGGDGTLAQMGSFQPRV